MATTIQVGRRLAELSPRAKLALMIGADALCLPLCAFLSVTLRLGSFEGALELGLFIQIALGLATLPVLGIAGLYRAVVRYIDLRVLITAGAALAAAVALVYATSHALNITSVPRSSSATTGRGLDPPLPPPHAIALDTSAAAAARRRGRMVVTIARSLADAGPGERVLLALVAAKRADCIRRRPGAHVLRLVRDGAPLARAERVRLSALAAVERPRLAAGSVGELALSVGERKTELGAVLVGRRGDADGAALVFGADGANVNGCAVAHDGILGVAGGVGPNG